MTCGLTISTLELMKQVSDIPRIDLDVTRRVIETILDLQSVGDVHAFDLRISEFHFTSLTSKSLLSTLSPILTQISLTVPAPGEATAANIFMASRVAMVSPSLTF